MYYITKRGQALQYEKYTQHESIYGGDVKILLYIGNTYQQILKNFEITFKTNLKLLKVNKMNYDTNKIK